MSTEARHAPIPPRPSVPPRPSTPPDDPDDEPSVFTPRAPRPATGGAAGEEGASPGAAPVEGYVREGRSSVGSAGGEGWVSGGDFMDDGRSWTGSARGDARSSAAGLTGRGSASDTGDRGAGPASVGGPAGTGSPSAAGSAGSGSRSAAPSAGNGAPVVADSDSRRAADGSPSGEAAAPEGRPFPEGPGPRAGQGRRSVGPRPVVPAAGAPVSPPPPPASARFPDAPPSPGRDAHRPGRESRRPGTPVETPSETTARLRPVTASGTAAPPRPVTPSETTARLRPVTGAPNAARPAAAPGRSSGGSGGERRTAAASPSTVSAGRTETGAWSPMAPAYPVGPPPPASSPDPALSWSSPAARPVMAEGGSEPFGGRTWHRIGPRTAAAAACLVLGLGLIGGAVAGSWLTDDGGDDASGDHFATAGALWHDMPVDQLFPPTVQGTGAGPGGADRTWTRIAVAPDTGCAHAFDPLLAKVLAPVGCRRLLRATYTDATQSYVTTVGLLFTKADPAGMSALAHQFRAERLDRRADLMPRPYAARGTAAAGFGDRQRASWTISVLMDAPVVAYAVSGWADGRSVDVPQPAADAVSAGATTAPAQAGLGNEAQGLADRVERRLRQSIGTATEKPS